MRPYGRIFSSCTHLWPIPVCLAGVHEKEVRSLFVHWNRPAADRARGEKMANKNLSKAKNAKNDEFYTQYADIQNEVNAYLDYDADVFRGKTVLLPCDDPEWSNFTKFFAQNFQRFGLKKLISTSFAAESKNYKHIYQPSLFEEESPQFDKKKTKVRGKIFVLDHDTNNNGKIDIEDLEWKYLEGDGDFRSEEVKKLRDEADIIVTNPPFSLFREFLAWILEGCGGSCSAAKDAKGAKKFLIIGNINCVTYKEVFPLIKSNRLWTGTRFNKRINGKNMTFMVPDDYPMRGTEMYEECGKKFISVAGTGWFTNLEHGRRHQPLQLMTMADNIKFSRHKELRGKEYLKYVNYEGIEVPFTDAIPCDYDGIMGVPISFLDKYCPEQFEIIGISLELADMRVIKDRLGKLNGGPRLYVEKDGELVRQYERILIRRREGMD